LTGGIFGMKRHSSFNVRHFTLALLAAALAVSVPGSVRGQQYPAKPVRVIVPFPPGGGTDIVARMVMQKVGERLGASFPIENRSGAGGMIGTEIVAKAAADGYTLGMVSGSHAINPGLYKKLAYDAVYDFSPITQLVSGPALLVVHPSVPARNVRELIAMAKARPGKLHYASAGNGTPPHLAAELFKSMAGVDMVHVPYKGNAAAFSDLIAGEVSVSFPTIPSALPQVKSERLRALAVTSAKRTPLLPELPTVAESGVRGYEAASWYGLLAPAGTPTAITGRLHQEVVQIVHLPEMKDRFHEQGLEPVGNTPAEFTKFLHAEIAKWRKVIAAAGAKVD
jgi:tripartite-type tricarboxylate transporter receptor subunit TctC